VNDLSRYNPSSTLAERTQIAQLKQWRRFHGRAHARVTSANPIAFAFLPQPSPASLIRNAATLLFVRPPQALVTANFTQVDHSPSERWSTRRVRDRFGMLAGLVDIDMSEIGRLTGSRMQYQRVYGHRAEDTYEYCLSCPSPTTTSRAFLGQAAVASKPTFFSAPKRRFISCVTSGR
jgi:hypothetical protein